MKRFIIAAGALALVIGCQKDTSDYGAKLDDIAKRLASIEQKLDSGARPGAAMPQQPQRPRPDANAVYSVPIDGAPYKGPEHAKVTIVKAYEHACPYCDRVRPTLDALKEKYGNDLKIAYKYLIVHPQQATTPALAACAAQQQGKFHEMDNLIWEKGFNAGRNLSQENMETLAKELNLDMNKFKADMDGACKAVIQKDQEELRRVGASGTPGFYINGRFLSGARPQQMFEVLIDEELKKANDALAKGAKLETYYNEHVVQKGVKQLAGM